jgi:hypothetical protein
VESCILLQPFGRHRKTIISEMNYSVHHHTIAVILLVLSTPGCVLCTSEPPLGSQTLSEYSLTLSPELAYLTSGGYWQQGSTSGRIRVLIYSGGHEHVTSKVILQWLTDPTPKRPQHIIAGVHVTELDGIYSFVDPRVQTVDGILTVYLSGVNSHTGESVRLVLEITGISRYRILQPHENS